MKLVNLDKETPTIIAKSKNPYNGSMQLEVRRTYEDGNGTLQRTKQGINVEWTITLDLLTAILELWNEQEETTLAIVDVNGVLE